MLQLPIKKIKLFLVDDHRMVIDMWSSLLGADPKFELVGAALNGEAALDEILTLLPCLVFLA